MRCGICSVGNPCWKLINKRYIGRLCRAIVSHFNYERDCITFGRSRITTAAAGDQPDPSRVGDDLTESVGSVNDADLVTIKSLASGDQTPAEGDTVSFEIEVTNNGATQATNVSLVDQLPAGITYTAVSYTHLTLPTTPYV